MLGFDARNAHVAGKRLSGDHHRYRLREPQGREECLRLIDVAHDDCQWLKCFTIFVPP